MQSRTQVQMLEAEAIYVLREAAAQFERPVILFSGGKDSTVVVRLAQKAFAPAPLKIPLLHIDTGHNFRETIEFRDWLVADTRTQLHVRHVQDSINSGRVVDETGPNASRNALQTTTLLDGILELGISAAIGGARRDEEKARAKERFFSHRNIHGQWNPRNQRPEVWQLLNGRMKVGEHFRVFPLSNWTEMDVWRYIQLEKLAVPSLYFAHQRDVFTRQGMLLARSPWMTLQSGEQYVSKRVRFRTVGDATCTGAMESDATTVEQILSEIALSQLTERGTRADDRRSDAAMEDRKRTGYF